MKKTPIVIDCDASPFVPDGWRIERHIKGGQLEWDPQKVILYLSEGQDVDLIRGYSLYKLLEREPVLNANVLDYLLANPHLIPDTWKGRCVYFWGTVYYDFDGGLCVPCLRWDGYRWHDRIGWLELGWGNDDPAALVRK